MKLSFIILILSLSVIAQRKKEEKLLNRKSCLQKLKGFNEKGANAK